MDKAGIRARKSVPDQLVGVSSSGQVGTDGLWARLLKGQKKVVLALVDMVTGVIFPPVVVKEEDNGRSWRRVFRRARLAGLDLDQLRGVVSDGANGLIGYVGRVLSWVNHQRCQFHIWRKLSGELASRVNEAAVGLTGGEAGDAAGRASGRGDGVPAGVQPRVGASLSRAVLAGLPVATQPRAEPQVGRAAGA